MVSPLLVDNVLEEADSIEYKKLKTFDDGKYLSFKNISMYIMFLATFYTSVFFFKPSFVIFNSGIKINLNKI